ncbi:Anillin/rhotekin (Rtkn), partial [Operophtera brumata]
MDPFTQRMLERARARQEKIDQKLANSGQAVAKRKPLTENINKSETSPSKPPAKTSRSSITSAITPAKNTRSSILSPRKSSTEPSKAITPVKAANRRSSTQKSDQLVVASPQRPRNDVIVTKNEFKSPKTGSMPRRNSDVSVEINIAHRNDIQIEVQSCMTSILFRCNKLIIKMCVSDNPSLSSPIHRTELNFHSETPPAPEPVRDEPTGKKKFGRLAALADQINNWEDDLSHHSF